MTDKMGVVEPKGYQVVCEVCSRKCKKCGAVVYGGFSGQCYECDKKDKVMSTSAFTVIDNTRYGGTEMNEAHYKHLNTRCVDDNGKALSGKEGLKFMESKGDTYSQRLKAYYK